MTLGGCEILGQRPASLREITGTPICHRQEGGQDSISRRGTLLRYVICDAVDCPCFQICACGGACDVRTAEWAVE